VSTPPPHWGEATQGRIGQGKETKNLNVVDVLPPFSDFVEKNP
jgi:hypothetical protein